jgi:hypothetical protein
VKRRFQIAVRRAIYSGLALLTVAALVLPLQTGESSASPLPACCLVHGEHHCMGQTLGGEPDVPGFSAANKCPYSPLALTALRSHQLAPPVGDITLANILVSAPLRIRSRISATFRIIGTHSERGPPISSLI